MGIAYNKDCAQACHRRFAFINELQLKLGEFCQNFPNELHFPTSLLLTALHLIGWFPDKYRFYPTTVMTANTNHVVKSEYYT